MNTRLLVRKAAAEIANQGEYPTPELVRTKIQAYTKGSLNPSNTTVNDELKKWRADTFWPTFNTFSSLPAESGVPEAVRQAFVEAYRMMVVNLLAKAKADWDDERAEFVRQLEQAGTAVGELRDRAASLEQDMVYARAEMSRDADNLRDAADANTKLQQENSQLSADLQCALQQQATHEREVNEARQAERHRADAAAEAARLEQNRLHVEIDNTRQAVKRLESATNAAVAETTRANERATNAERELAAVRAELKAAQTAHASEVANLSKALATARAASQSSSETGRKVAGAPRGVQRPVRQSLRKQSAR